MSGERDELPKGWNILRDENAYWMAWGPFVADTAPAYRSRSRVEAIAAAWRIVDAEKEATDGR